MIWLIVAAYLVGSVLAVPVATLRSEPRRILIAIIWPVYLVGYALARVSR